jgi:hypothetical protein
MLFYSLDRLPVQPFFENSNRRQLPVSRNALSTAAPMEAYNATGQCDVGLCQQT